MRTLRTYRIPLRLAGFAAALVLAAGCAGEPGGEPDAAALETANARGATPPATREMPPAGEDPGVDAMEMDADTGEGSVPPGRYLPETDRVGIELLDSRAFTVAIDPDGSIRLNDLPVAKGELPYRFRSLKRKFEDPEMLLRHPADLPYDEVRAVIDIAQEAGITDINVMTRARPAE